MQARLDGTVASVRALAAELRPRVLDDLGLTAACEWLAERTTTRGGLRVELEADQDDYGLSDAVRTAVFRVVQEALTNVLRHARAARAQVRLETDGRQLRASVEDDGVGLPAGYEQTGTFGVLGMRERMHSVGGRLSIGPGPGGGTRVLAEVALTTEERDG